MRELVRSCSYTVLLIPLLFVLSACGSDTVAQRVEEPVILRGDGVARPQIEGPVSGGQGQPFLATTTFDLAEAGYSEAEFFLSGTASSYRTETALQSDGHWSVHPAGEAAYRTRIVVYRPIDPRKFNGTVIVEWLNVSGGLDAASDWLMGHRVLVREGFAWVGVSVQYAGVEGGGSLLGLITADLKTMDRERYGSLVHPGDSFTYHIFSQVAQAIRRPGTVRPLGDLDVRAVIAAGESQSAFRMVTYANGVHPIADIYDGFFIHSRGGNGLAAAALSELPQAEIAVPNATLIRSDLNVPVFTFQTETDLTILGSASIRQPDTDRLRLWEVAGTAHADTYTTIVGAEDRGNSPAIADLILTTSPVIGFDCAQPVNSGPQHFVLNAALHAMNRWVREGIAPPLAPLLEVAGGTLPSLLRDQYGNAKGGIRTPYVDVPIAKFTGDARGSILCLLFGTTTPFTAERLAELYPTHDAYVRAYEDATDRAVRAGFILPEDARLMKSAAAASSVGR